MYIKEEKYHDKLIQILYPEKGYLLQHKQTKICYGSVSLEDGREQEDYDEIPEPEEDEPNPID